MGYGNYLERRKFGVYYFRQTAEVNGKQVVRRISLRTKDTRLAKLLALQMKARAAMIDPHGVRRFEVEWGADGAPKKLKVTDDADARNLAETMKLMELHRAEKHKRELATKQVEAEIAEKLAAREKEAFINSDEGRRLLSLYERLNELPEKQTPPPQSTAPPAPADGADEGPAALTDLMAAYLSEVTVKPGTHGKYRRLIGRLIDFGKTRGVTTSAGLTKKFVNAFRVHLRTMEKKSPDTIRNIFYTLSTFYNYLLSTAEVVADNSFVGQWLPGDNETESARDLWRLQPLRRWSHEQVEQVLT